MQLLTSAVSVASFTQGSNHPLDHRHEQPHAVVDNLEADIPFRFSSHPIDGIPAILPWAVEPKEIPVFTESNNPLFPRVIMNVSSLGYISCVGPPSPSPSPSPSP